MAGKLIVMFYFAFAVVEKLEEHLFICLFLAFSFPVLRRDTGLGLPDSEEVGATLREVT